MSYNGYPNRATWNVNLWLDNEEASYRAKQDFLRRTPRIGGVAVRRFCEEMFGNRTPDGCLLANVHWASLAASWRDEKQSQR
jgi:hypothetical protein